jgi:hypothetical protein
MFTDEHNAPLGNQPKVTFEDVRHRAEAEEIMVYGIGLVGECDSVRRDAPLRPLLSFQSPAPAISRRGGPVRPGRSGGGATDRAHATARRLPMPPCRRRRGHRAVPAYRLEFLIRGRVPAQTARLLGSGRIQPEGADRSWRRWLLRVEARVGLAQRLRASQTNCITST